MTFGKQSLSLFTYSCLLFVLTLPLPILFNNFAIAVLVLTWLFGSTLHSKWKTLKEHRSAHWIFMLYAFYILSLLYTTNKEEGWARLETKLSLFALPFMVLSSPLKKNEIKSVLFFFVYAMIGIGVFLIGIAIVRYFKTEVTDHFFYHQLTEPLGLHAIYFANYLCLGVLVLIFCGFLKNKTIDIALLIISVILIIMLSALSVTGYLIVLSIMGIWLFFRKNLSLPKAIISASLSIVFISMLIFLVPRMREKIKQIDQLDYKMDDPDYAWNSITLRLAMWQSALPVISKNPVIGVGVGDENQILQESYSKFDFKEGIRCNYNVHNQYLSTWMAIGIIGLMLLICMIFFPALNAFRTNDWLFFSFLVLMAFSFFTENFLSVQKGVIFFSFFYALLLKRAQLSTTFQSYSSINLEI